MATNVQLLDQNRAHQYIDAGLDDIMLSIDGITKKTFETIRVKLDYETVVNNTLNLIKDENDIRVNAIEIAVYNLEQRIERSEQW